MRKVPEEPSFDVLFRKLVLLSGSRPPGTHRRDKRKCSDGQMEENRVKYGFFLICLFLYLRRGQDRKRKPFSPAGLEVVTQLQIIVASLVVSH